MDFVTVCSTMESTVTLYAALFIIIRLFIFVLVVTVTDPNVLVFVFLQ